jgi:hypothetical protein
MRIASTVLTPLRAGPASGTALVRALQVSQPALSHALASLQREGRVLKIGASRGSRYGMLRTVPGTGSTWPVFQVDTAGRILEAGRLHALVPSHSCFESDHAALRGLVEGLPWFLRDQRPSGFMAGGLRADEWNDDQHLAWCTRDGWDCVGDLVVGAEALENYRRSLQQRRIVQAADRAVLYPRLAAEAEAGRHGAGQLAGERPKFTVLADHGGHLVQAIVKFSPSMDSPAGQRWADLLIAEHLAHLHLNARGVGAVHSRVYRHGGRIFLEVDRFDRVGAEGRRGVVSLQALDFARSAQDESWSIAAIRLAASGVLPRTDSRQIRLIEAFARLIANTDVHAGNLSFFTRPDGGFALAPVYDMLPMLFAPQGAAIPDPHFTAPGPDPEMQDVWPHARRLAEGYWERLAGEQQLSAGFRALCVAARLALRQ